MTKMYIVLRITYIVKISQ